ncbi:unnamed protein product [Callosobruchus maculatus]|uniref:Secreted protein n=1 Tax=Callosobruchus maculatus TaxID=64391 RepID=A0A653DM78_CALMS|nr:unnamed protein product [Callosobruchus maculatus]
MNGRPSVLVVLSLFIIFGRLVKVRTQVNGKRCTSCGKRKMRRNHRKKNTTRPSIPNGLVGRSTSWTSTSNSTTVGDRALGAVEAAGVAAGVAQAALGAAGEVAEEAGGLKEGPREKAVGGLKDPTGSGSTEIVGAETERTTQSSLRIDPKTARLRRLMTNVTSHLLVRVPSR